MSYPYFFNIKNVYWTTLCFSFDDQNVAPIKKKDDVSVWHIDGNTLCWHMAKWEKKDVEWSFGPEKSFYIKKRIWTIG